MYFAAHMCSAGVNLNFPLKGRRSLSGGGVGEGILGKVISVSVVSGISGFVLRLCLGRSGADDDVVSDCFRFAEDDSLGVAGIREGLGGDMVPDTVRFCLPFTATDDCDEASPAVCLVVERRSDALSCIGVYDGLDRFSTFGTVAWEKDEDNACGDCGSRLTLNPVSLLGLCPGGSMLR